MTQPVTMTIRPLPPVDLGAVRQKFQQLADAKSKVREYRKNLSQWEQYQKRLEAELAALMGNATTGVIDGKEVLTYEPRDQFAHARFIKDHGELAQVFMRTAEIQELDWRALLAAEPEIAGPYVTRIMRVLD